MKKIAFTIIFLVFAITAAAKTDIDFIVTNINNTIELAAKTHDPKYLYRSYNMIQEAIALDCDMIQKACKCKNCIRECQSSVTFNNKLLKSIDLLLKTIEDLKKNSNAKYLDRLHFNILDSKKIILGCRRSAFRYGPDVPEVPPINDLEPASHI